MVKKIPEGYATLTASLTIDGASKAIDLYKKAFGATEEGRMSWPNSDKIMHAVLKIGNSRLFVADTAPEMGCGEPTSSVFYVYMDDVDAAFKQAKQAGMGEKMAPTDMFWGDRTGAVTDPYSNIWTLATHVRDVSDKDMEEAKKNFGKKAA